MVAAGGLQYYALYICTSSGDEIDVHIWDINVALKIGG